MRSALRLGLRTKAVQPLTALSLAPNAGGREALTLVALSEWPHPPPTPPETKNRFGGTGLGLVIGRDLATSLVRSRASRLCGRYCSSIPAAAAPCRLCRLPRTRACQEAAVRTVVAC